MTKTHQKCPKCGANDAYTDWGSGRGFCHSACGNVFTEEYVDSKTKTPSSITYEDIRGLDAEVAKKYGIQIQLDEKGNPFRFAFKYPHTIKYRDYHVKSKQWIKDVGVGMSEFFGPKINPASSKRIYITEGEFDAASLYQAMDCTWPVVSLPSASIGDNFIKKHYEFLNSFQEVVYAGELDKAGKGAADRIYRAIPSKFYFIPLHKWKDANEALEAGDVTELKWTALRPQRWTPDNFFCSDDKTEQILREENPYEYTPTYHSGLNEKIRGLVKGCLTFFLAPPGTGKCLHPDQGVLMFDGSIKAAKDVVAGDKVMGDNGSMRNVLSTTAGQEEMFKITPVKGEPWICNKSHILSLVNTDTGNIVDISVADYLGKSAYFKDRHKQYRSDVVPFKEKELPYDPYVVGAYLGDGHTHRCAISLGPKKSLVASYISQYFEGEGYSVVEKCFGYSCNEYQISNGYKRGSFWSFIKEYVGPRRIPFEYKTGSVTQRQQLLAGILDTDGHVSYGGCDIIQKSKELADDICYVARSLGLAAYVKETTKGIKSSGFTGTYYRVSISGDLSCLPTLRLDFEKRKQVKSVLRTGIKVESLGVGDYCGFCIDGNKRFLLDDFTVTHNTEVFRYLERGALEHSEEVKIAPMHAEEPKSMFYRAAATYELGKNVRTKEDAKDNGVSEDEVIEAAKKATKGDRTILFEMQGGDDPMAIVDYCRLAAGVYGANYVFVDHVQRLAYLGGIDGATSVLTKLASNLAQLSKELNIGIILISHVNEDGHTKYAKSLEEEAGIIVKLERDKESEDPETRNTTKFNVVKNRPFSKLGYAGAIFYDTETTLLKEVEV